MSFLHVSVWQNAAAFPAIPADRPGSYVLLVRLPRACRLAAGRLPERVYRAGWYAYAGSALNGLRGRLNRYLRTARKRHWHIDYLVDHGEVEGAWLFPGRERLECRLAAHLRETFEGVPGFGATDCRCGGHLFHARDAEDLRRVLTFGAAERLS